MKPLRKKPDASKKFRVAIPQGTKLVGGEVLTGVTRSQKAMTRERRRDRMYALMAEHPESASELYSRVKASRKISHTPNPKLGKAVRRAEASEFDRKRAAIKDQVSDVGTGQTILKKRDKPIDWLIKNRKIGPEELRAAEEITQAIYAITRSLRCRGINYDRVDNGRSQGHDWPAKFAKVVGRYQTFASVWSARQSRYGDPTLEIIVSAVVDEAPIRKLASEHGYRFARVERGLIFGLRDYAVRAGFVRGAQAEKWQREAELVFGPPIELRKAMQRARLEV